MLDRLGCIPRPDIHRSSVFGAFEARRLFPVERSELFLGLPRGTPRRHVPAPCWPLRLASTSHAALPMPESCCSSKDFAFISSLFGNKNMLFPSKKINFRPRCLARDVYRPSAPSDPRYFFREPSGNTPVRPGRHPRRCASDPRFPLFLVGSSFFFFLLV